MSNRTLWRLPQGPFYIIHRKVMFDLRKGVVSVLALCFSLFSGLAWGDESVVEKKGVLMVSFGRTVPSVRGLSTICTRHLSRPVQG